MNGAKMLFAGIERTADPAAQPGSLGWYDKTDADARAALYATCGTLGTTFGAVISYCVAGAGATASHLINVLLWQSGATNL